MWGGGSCSGRLLRWGSGVCSRGSKEAGEGGLEESGRSSENLTPVPSSGTPIPAPATPLIA